MALSDRAPSRREALFGGKGAVVVWDLLGRASADPFTAVLWCALEPGGSVGRHVQEHFPEILIGLDGQGEARVGDTTHPLMPGDVVHLPLGAVLSIENLSSEEPLSYLIIKARAPA